LFQTEDGVIIDLDGIERREGEFQVYNFEVEDFHTYFVSDLEILVHNACRTDIIDETMTTTGNFTSSHNINADDALDTAETFLGPGYTQLGTPNSGVFRSADGLRQFRIDDRSLQGLHPPGVPHIHFELLNSRGNIISNNHVPLI
jgi:hypothetical protein